MSDRIIDALCAADIEEDVDGESFPDGSVIDHTTYTITMTRDYFEEFVSALGFEVGVTESAYEILMREIKRRNDREYKE